MYVMNETKLHLSKVQLFEHDFTDAVRDFSIQCESFESYLSANPYIGTIGSEQLRGSNRSAEFRKKWKTLYLSIHRITMFIKKLRAKEASLFPSETTPGEYCYTEYRMKQK